MLCCYAGFESQCLDCESLTSLNISVKFTFWKPLDFSNFHDRKMGRELSVAKHVSWSPVSHLPWRHAGIAKAKGQRIMRHKE